MIEIITKRFLEVDDFLILQPTQQSKIVNAFVDGYWNHNLENWQCRMTENAIICNYITSTTLIRGKEDVLDLHRYSDFDLRKCFRRILGEQIEENTYITFGNGGFMKLITK
jgi:hypothetical protein